MRATSTCSKPIVYHARDGRDFNMMDSYPRGGTVLNGRLRAVAQHAFPSFLALSNFHFTSTFDLARSKTPKNILQFQNSPMTPHATLNISC
jgi:hypothetical protein